jgi:hypothetical protein
VTTCGTSIVDEYGRRTKSVYNFFVKGADLRIVKILCKVYVEMKFVSDR